MRKMLSSSSRTWRLKVRQGRRIQEFTCMRPRFTSRGEERQPPERCGGRSCQGRSGPSGTDRTAGRASDACLRCKNSIGTSQEALSECEDAKKYSRNLAKDDIGHVRAINAQGSILWDMNQSEAAAEVISRGVGLCCEYTNSPSRPVRRLQQLGIGFAGPRKVGGVRKRFEFAKDGFEKQLAGARLPTLAATWGRSVSVRETSREAERYFEKAMTAGRQIQRQEPRGAGTRQQRTVS